MFKTLPTYCVISSKAIILYLSMPYGEVYTIPWGTISIAPDN